MRISEEFSCAEMYFIVQESMHIVNVLYLDLLRLSDEQRGATPQRVNQVSPRLLRRVHRVRRRVEGGREACGPQACVQPRRSYAKFCGEWSESGGRTREAAEFLVLHSSNQITNEVGMLYCGFGT